MSNATYNDSKNKRSSSDRMFELLNQKYFSPCEEKDATKSRCNIVEPTSNSRKSGYKFTDENGNPTSIHHTSNAINSSDRTDILSTQTITCKDDKSDSNCSNSYWHNQSDRTNPHGGGVDIKHGSYERYLAKKKINTI